ncbi:MAG: hypothetical protein MUP48_04110 [Wolbachia endosymbiont of Homalodisca vitripennis]|nr:hypothetical protein [Wolbachia endosymbiont of Homalodisca vitripennis]MCJ7454612.1 hypothetical protein [Wolbachia endosymbiont of Homalodisca vitripennis]MCJ7476197.1 hypothetical protein [Wolbachia endosymbiont of Homalodisca vitripennis]
MHRFHQVVEAGTFSLIECITDSNRQFPSNVLSLIEESCKLTEFWKVISINDRKNIISTLMKQNDNASDQGNQSTCIRLLKEIAEIEKKIKSIMHPIN